MSGLADDGLSAGVAPNAAAIDPGEESSSRNELEGPPLGVYLERKSSVQFLVNSSSSKLAAITGLILKTSPTRTLQAGSNGGNTHTYLFLTVSKLYKT